MLHSGDEGHLLFEGLRQGDQPLHHLVVPRTVFNAGRVIEDVGSLVAAELFAVALVFESLR